jgi:hypothetical protein
MFPPHVCTLYSTVQDGDIKIGLEVEDRVMGKTEPKHFTIDCQ